MVEVNIPSDASQAKVDLRGSSGELKIGQLFYKKWNPSEIRSRAFKKTTKATGITLAIGIPGLLIPLVHFFVAPALVIALIAQVYLYFKRSGETSTVFGAHGFCDHCKRESKFRPYLDAQVLPEMTLQCPECGETTKALLKEEPSDSSNDTVPIQP